MSLLAFFARLADIPWSIGLHESQYAYSIIESIHVWTMALFFGLTVMFDLRLLGWTMRKVPVSEVVGRLLPLDHCGVRRHGHQRHAAVLRHTAAVLSEHFLQDQNAAAAAGRPERVDLSLARLSRRSPGGISTRCRRGRPGLAGAISLVLWIGIIVSGRMIAYNWFDCDRQPQAGDHQFPDQLRTHRTGAVMSLLPFFQWCYQTPIGEAIRNSTWLFPVIEAFHSSVSD